MMLNSTIRFFAMGLLIFTVASQAESVHMITDRVPSADEMGAILFKNKTTDDENGIGSRTLSFKKKNVDSQVKPANYASSQGDTIGLPINFEFGESTIIPSSLPSLDEIGKMLTKPIYQNERLRIEGHTDAFGSELGNQELSEQRAAAVKEYLIDRFNIKPDRLVTVGLGESQPLAGTDPNDGGNRRVQLKAQP